MIVIADSGSTKTDWCLVKNTDTVKRLHTAGLNPLHTSPEVFSDTIKQLFNKTEIADISHVYFYSAGCGQAEVRLHVTNELKQIFMHAAVEVETDLLGAARGLGKMEACAIGIIGTGSHAGVYNGNSLTLLAPSLGYILGDEGAGVWLGKRLLGDYFYSKMPLDILFEFKNTYKPNREECIKHIYHTTGAATYLAGFAGFISTHRHDPYIHAMLTEGFTLFIEHNVSHLHIDPQTPMHFTGSIACMFETELRATLDTYHIHTGHFVPKPIDGLIYFHTHQHR